jgi:hypothetical protein
VKLVPRGETTPSSDVLLEEIIVAQLVKNFQALDGTGVFITMLKKAQS